MLALTTGALPALALVATSPANSQTQVAFRYLVLAGPLVKWGAPVLGTGATLTLAVVRDEQQFPGVRNCGGMGLLTAGAIDRGAFDAGQEVALAAGAASQTSLSCRGEAPDADILIGAETEARGPSFASVAYRTVDGGGNLDVCDPRCTLRREIGHAIGLGHSGREGQVTDFRYRAVRRMPKAGDVAGVVAL